MVKLNSNTEVTRNAILPVTNDFFLRLETSSGGGSLEYVVQKPNAIPQSMKAEAVNAARLIAEKFNAPICLPLSGGIDSEAMAEAFIAAKVPFTAVVFRYQNNFNEYDISSAIRFCQLNSVPTKVVDINLDDFFKSNRHLDIAEKYQCRSPQIAVHIFGALEVKGCVVFPHNPIALYNRQDHFYWEFPQNLYLSYDRFFAKESREGVGLFFLYTRELIYSYLGAPIYKNLITRPNGYWRIYSRDPYLVKCELYRQGGFKVLSRRAKATGFEMYRRHLNQVNVGRYQHDYFDEHFRRPMELVVNESPVKFSGTVDLSFLHSMWNSPNWSPFQ